MDVSLMDPNSSIMPNHISDKYFVTSILSSPWLVRLMVTLFAPASMAFSTSSFATEATEVMICPEVIKDTVEEGRQRTDMACVKEGSMV